jgi:hypothetical protein
MVTRPGAQSVEIRHIDRLILYARNPRKNDVAVDRMCGSIREFRFKIPCLVRSDGEVVDGHLRLKAGGTVRRREDAAKGPAGRAKAAR